MAIKSIRFEGANAFMKKLIALMLVLALVGTLAACTQVTRISVENPAKIMIEKEGGGVAVTLTEQKTVSRITDVVCQIPLQAAEEHLLGEIVTPDRVPAVSITASLGELMHQALSHSFIPVVDDTGTFIGIVTRTAVMRYCFAKHK